MNIYSKTPEQARVEFSNACENLISALNEYIDARMINLLYELKQYKFFKHEIKKAANMSAQALKRNLSVAHERFLRIGNKYKTDEELRLMRLRSNIHVSYVDNFSELFDHEAEKLRLAFLKICNDNNVGELSDIYCKVEIVRLLLQMSCQSYDEMCQGTKAECGVNYYETYKFYRPSLALAKITEVEVLLQKLLPKVSFSFKESATVMNAFRKLQNKLVKGEYLTQCAINAFDEYYDELPEEYKQIHEENKRKLSEETKLKSA